VFIGPDTVCFVVDPTRSGAVLARHVGIGEDTGQLTADAGGGLRRLVISSDLCAVYRGRRARRLTAWSITLSRRKMSLPGRVFSKAALKVLPLLIRPGKFERSRPDFTVDEGHDLSEYGLDAKILHIPGHSKSPIRILTADGDLFCGDLLEYASTGYSPACR
jgi:glyoxylase-like metal-dependent hydrolase (beta-lactamase superfamily II)